MLSENACGFLAEARLPARIGCPGSARRATPVIATPMVFLPRVHRPFASRPMCREPSSIRLFGRIDSTSRRTRSEPGCHDIP
jgi:hypothetical protein